MFNLPWDVWHNCLQTRDFGAMILTHCATRADALRKTGGEYCGHRSPRAKYASGGLGIGRLAPRTRSRTLSPLPTPNEKSHRNRRPVAQKNFRRSGPKTPSKLPARRARLQSLRPIDPFSTRCFMAAAVAADIDHQAKAAPLGLADSVNCVLVVTCWPRATAAGRQPRWSARKGIAAWRNSPRTTQRTRRPQPKRRRR